MLLCWGSRREVVPGVRSRGWYIEMYTGRPVKDGEGNTGNRPSRTRISRYFADAV